MVDARGGKNLHTPGVLVEYDLEQKACGSQLDITPVLYE